MNRLPRFLRRWLVARRIRHWQAEIAHLEHVRQVLGPQLDRALRNLGNARAELVFIDVRRPPITHAIGIGKRDGMDRSAQIREAQLRG